MPNDSRRVKDLFIALLDIADPNERSAFLDLHCASDPELRRRLEVLLRAHDDPNSVVDRPLVSSAESHTDAFIPERVLS